MSDPRPVSPSEQLDADDLGGPDDGSRLPGEEYPPDRPLGLDDPGLEDDGTIVPDDARTRAAREQPEPGERPVAGRVEHPEPMADDAPVDVEPELVADAGSDPRADADRAAEVDAMRIDEDRA